MTRYFYLLFLLLSGLSTAFAQNNYVISRSYKAATPTATSGATFWGTSQQATSSVQYFDKLGKPRQEVSVYGSNTPAKDLVVTKGYNNRHQLVTVTPPATNSSGSSGGFAGSVDLGFYTTGAGKVVAPVESNRLDLVSTRFFYEDSPLGRVRYTSPVGLTATAASTFKVNTTGDNVKRYRVSDTGLPVTTDNYAAGELTFVNNVDEAGKVSQEFKDYRGQTVLRRATHPQGNLDTYYVYDAKGQLRFVLQPEYQVSADVGLYAFRYEYDLRGNMTKKKVPGANEVVMTYDGRDRMSTMTDGKSQSFSYEYEDNLNRLKTVKFKGPGMGAYQDVLKYYYDTYPSDRRLLTYKNDVFPEWSSAAGTYYLPSNGLDKARQGYQVATDARVVNSDGTLSDTWLLTLNVYDDRYQIIQIVRHLYGVGNEAYERISYLRDFEGKVSREQTDQGSSSWAYHLQKEFAYDHMSRLTKTTHKVWEGNATPVTYTHSEVTYNEIGTPKTKKLHNGMHEVAIKPHVRGWLGAVNQTTGKTFSLGLEYEVNGNVKTVNWGTNGYSGGMSASYDEVNRLKETTGWGSFSGHSEKVDEYDRNGNIKKLSRYKGGAMIDNLTIGHRGNQMQTISDAGSNTEGYKQQPGTSGDVTYDNNGNMVEDPGRKLKLDYNLINLARKVNINGNDRLKYVYDASGVKLNLDAAGTNTYYAGAFEYSGSGNLKRIAVEEGQIIRNSTNNFTVQYYLRDHLGNVRMVLDQNGNVVQETEYYAFGMTVDRTTGSNQYLYNGKEKQPETDFFDFGARQYDAILGRWMSVDPKAAHPNQLALSTFNAFWNSPLRYTDPDGKCPLCEANVKNPSEGQIYRTRGALYTFSSGQWVRESGQLKEIVVRPEGFYGSAGLAYNGDTRGVVAGYSAGYLGEGDYASADINITGFRGEYTNYSGTGEGKAALEAAAKVTGLQGSALLDLWSKNKTVGVGVGAEGNVLLANAAISAGVFTGENNKNGFMAAGEAGAYALKGEVNPSVSIMGYKIGATVGGSLGSIGGGFGLGGYRDKARGTFHGGFFVDLSFIGGIKFGFQFDGLPPVKYYNDN